MTDREHAGIRGNVKTCRTEREYQYPDGPLKMYTDQEFLPAGNILVQRHRNPDGSEWAVIHEYDGYGRLRKKQRFAGKTTPEEISIYEYDELGRLERVVEHSHGSQRISESLRYTSDGRKTRSTYPTPLTDEQKRNTSACGAAILHWSADAVCIMELFDSDDRVVRKVLYDADDRVIRRIAFTYDELGQLIEEGELIGGRIREDFRHVYRYDAFGRQIESDMRWGDLLGERRQYRYNNHDDRAEEMIEQISLLDDGDNPTRWTQRFRYTYDERGNWTERVTEVLRQNLEASISMIERREMTYY